MTHNIKKHDLVKFSVAASLVLFNLPYVDITGIVLSDPCRLSDDNGHYDTFVNVLWLDDKGTRTTESILSLRVISEKK